MLKIKNYAARVAGLRQAKRPCPNENSRQKEVCAKITYWIFTHQDIDRAHAAHARLASVETRLHASSCDCAAAASAELENEQISVGTRVFVRGRLGTVRFAGPVHYAEGEFLGVELDEPGGKNSGTVRGVAYFECAHKRGLILKKDEVCRADEPEPHPS